MLWEPLLICTGQEESQQQLQDFQAMLETPSASTAQGHTSMVSCLCFQQLVT